MQLEEELEKSSQANELLILQGLNLGAERNEFVRSLTQKEHEMEVSKKCLAEGFRDMEQEYLTDVHVKDKKINEFTEKVRSLENRVILERSAVADKEHEMKESMTYLEKQFDTMREKMQAQVAMRDRELERLRDIRVGVSPHEAAILTLTNDLEEYHSPTSTRSRSDSHRS